MEKQKTTEYEAPRIEDHGDLTELTSGSSKGTVLDHAFPAGTPLQEILEHGLTSP